MDARMTEMIRAGLNDAVNTKFRFPEELLITDRKVDNEFGFALVDGTGQEQVALKRLEDEHRKQRLVSKAKQRLENGTYGMCLSCDEEIAPKRLKAIPWAEYCIRCQEFLDQNGPENLVH